MSLPPRQQVLDPVPLVVAQYVAAHRSAPKADRLASVVSHAKLYNMIGMSYTAWHVDEQFGIGGNA